MRGTGLVMIITRFRNCLWNFMTKYENYDINLTLSWTDSGVQISLYHGQHWFRWWLCSCSIQSHYLNRCIESRLVPLDTLGTRLSANTVHCTRTGGVLVGTISIGIDIQHFQLIKSISKWRLQDGRHIFQASIWLFENVPGSMDTLGAKPSVNIVYKTMFLIKISENIYILPVLASTVTNQISQKTTLPYESHFLYLTKKRHIQTQARQDKSWQGMARPGEAWPDEARRGGAQTRRCPLVLKNTVSLALTTMQDFEITEMLRWARYLFVWSPWMLKHHW